MKRAFRRVVWVAAMVVLAGCGATGKTTPLPSASYADPSGATPSVLVSSSAEPTPSPSASPTMAPAFTLTGSMTWARMGATATRLQDGRVLIAGGANKGTALGSAELFDPATETFASTGQLANPRLNATATLLLNGRVLVVGGQTWDGNFVQQAEIYDPEKGTFSPAGRTSYYRLGHSATLLPDGRVLIAGGSFRAAATAELYDPKTNTFHLTGSMTQGRDGHSATLLQDGRVLIAGGRPSDASAPIQSFATAELYDPKTGKFTATGEMTANHYWHTATLLQDGRVLIAGGIGQHGYKSLSDLYDPIARTFSGTGPLGGVRASATATLLADGRVLVVGGAGDDGLGGVGDLATAELYDPAKKTFGPAGSMSVPRLGATTTLLPDGRVLIAGGQTEHGAAAAVASAELYQPSPRLP